MVDTDPRVDKMSVLQQVLTDARKLATRLRDHDSSSDALLSQTQGMFKQVESMKEYCEEMNELNEAANNRPRSALIHSIQQENRHIRQLQQENKELRLALEEHQNVMELIMSKYRQQVAKLVSVNKKQMQPNTQDQAKLAAQIERVSEMVAVMRKAASLGDDECQQQQRLISALATENKGLREMLSIANRSGSIQPATTAVDAETQTDHDLLKVEEDREEEDETPTQADSSNLNTTQIEQKSAETEGTSAS
ncbi:FGFR1 oncogene partner 2 homolog isoform X2 [Penaeus chinensis]|uniref:FGFR1 oncogene partner 2 homolog isoform X2 n=2 Tax=Penaeus chinensis TaxID=139456 RepID=UPI001FB6B0B6|nr:FGFR1 oncogene partner 2 homolog isoform X2 [Penaeus chinensis]